MKKVITPSAVAGDITPPCSKSYAQRVLAAALLCEGETRISNLDICDDTRHAMNVIETLGARIIHTGNSTYNIRGGLNPAKDIIDIGESGLSARMFTPIAALCTRKITVTGHGSIMNRPIDMLTTPLRSLGVNVNTAGHLPISVQGPIVGGKANVDASVSSQHLTGLLISLPLALNGSSLTVDKINSLPYVKMTLETISRFGIRIEHNDFKEFYIPSGQTYVPADISIEGDWSCAAYLLTAGALAGEITLRGLNILSLQADTAIIDALARTGAAVITDCNCITVRKRKLNGFDFDATHCPDLFPILAVLGANCRGTTTIKGVERLAYKESDRGTAIRDEYSKIGADIHIDGDIMTIRGGEIHGGIIDSRNDHRIAMAAAIAGLTATSPVTINNPDAVNKSYPRFWDDLRQIKNEIPDKTTDI